jgi:hypothetical protein
MRLESVIDVNSTLGFSISIGFENGHVYDSCTQTGVVTFQCLAYQLSSCGTWCPSHVEGSSSFNSFQLSFSLEASQHASFKLQAALTSEMSQSPRYSAGKYLLSSLNLLLLAIYKSMQHLPPPSLEYSHTPNLIYFLVSS